MEFDPINNDDQLERLGGFSQCEVFLEGPEKRQYVVTFDAYTGQLSSVSFLTERDKKYYYPNLK